MPLLSTLKLINWSYYFRCNRCDFAQQFPNPKVVVHYELGGTDPIRAIPEFGWCDSCEAVVYVEPVELPRSVQKSMQEAETLKSAARQALLYGRFFKARRLRKQRAELLEWVETRRQRPPRQSKQRCLRCGDETRGTSLAVVDQETLPADLVFVKQLSSHSGCSGQGTIVQLNEFAVREDSRFWENAEVLDYDLYPEEANIPSDVAGFRCILLDEEGRLIGGYHPWAQVVERMAASAKARTGGPWS